MEQGTWETYLLNEGIVCAICYWTERSLLQIVMASSLAEWAWHSCPNMCCVLEDSPSSIFVYTLHLQLCLYRTYWTKSAWSITSSFPLPTTIKNDIITHSWALGRTHSAVRCTQMWVCQLGSWLIQIHPCFQASTWTWDSFVPTLFNAYWGGAVLSLGQQLVGYSLGMRLEGQKEEEQLAVQCYNILKICKWQYKNNNRGNQ